MPGTVTLDCPAKLNLALAVSPPDPLDPAGLHPIASWMAALAFFDTLQVESLSSRVGSSHAERESTFRFSYASDAPSPRAIDWPLEADLVYRAHALVQKHIGQALPVRVELQKRIPTGAGLGGGSSDAAGMIVALDRLFDLKLSTEVYRRLADQLGSDVHFALSALRGVTSAIVTGTGDALEPACRSSAWPLDVVLVLPEFGCPTGPVYAAFDRRAAPVSPCGAEVLRQLLRDYSPGGEGLFNHLAAAAAEVEPRLRALLNDLAGISPWPVHVTGSGAVCFVVVESAAQAQNLAGQFVAEVGVTAIATHTL